MSFFGLLAPFEFFDPAGMLFSLLVIFVPFVFLRYVGRIRFSREELALLFLTIVGTLVDHRAFIYTSFVYANAYIRSGVYRKQKSTIALVVFLQLAYYLLQIHTAIRLSYQFVF